MLPCPSSVDRASKPTATLFNLSAEPVNTKAPIPTPTLQSESELDPSLYNQIDFVYILNI